MTAAHFFVEALHAGSIQLSAQDSRHALRSLRMRPGEEVTLADGRGIVGRGRLRGEDGALALVDVESISNVGRPTPAVRMVLSPPTGDRLAWAVQKLGELGVDEVLLVESERSVRTQPALPRLRAVAREAAMQSRRPFVMDVTAGATLRNAMATRGSPTVMLWEGADAPLTGLLPEVAEEVRLLVGPEGGFSDEELRAARESGLPLASLGPGILRTETAAVVGAALILAHYGRLG